MAYYSELILIFIFLITGLVGVAGTLHFPVYQGGLPGPGLFPIVLGSLLIILSLANFYELKFRTKEKKDRLDKNVLQRVALFFALLVAMTLLGTEVIGMLPALGVFLCLAQYIWYKSSVKFSLGYALLLMLSLMAVFSFIDTNFPMGLWE